MRDNGQPELKTEHDICAYLGISTLAGAKLDGLDLTGADLRNTNLAGASVHNVVWNDTDLRGADLTDVEGLNLRSFVIGAQVDHTTTLPDGAMERMYPIAMSLLAQHAPANVLKFVRGVMRRDGVDAKVVPFAPKPK